MIGVFLFQHTAARRRLDAKKFKAHELSEVSTHSRPKAAGLILFYPKSKDIVSTHSRPKAAGTVNRGRDCNKSKFQHTAARRRLAYCGIYKIYCLLVSTHSRPKAAGYMPFPV